jgi:hypothetical protein
MAVSFSGISKKKKSNRKELWLDADEIMLLRFASKYYSTDATTTIRILMRAGVIQLIAKQRRDGVPKITAEMQKALEEMDML